uniref:Uncharacterized protein n=1 Tax=Arundo donax TaxID=35708 RepID=A0A0A9AT13_ARUDO
MQDLMLYMIKYHISHSFSRLIKHVHFY